MKTMGILMALVVAVGLRAADLDGKKVCDCPWIEDPPEGVWAWAHSERVAKGQGKESRFVPYNSEAAKGLVLDANVARDVPAAPSSAPGSESSFYTVCDDRGWFVYVQCMEPDIQKLRDEGKDVALEIFFAPGMQEVPYYQLMVAQLQGTARFVDWGMPHRGYRSLKDRVRVESLPVKGGAGTFLFLPWEALYDRLPLDGGTWRFTVIRWKPAMTWGGNVHDTGNFGLVRFPKPTPAVREAVERRVLRAAWGRFRREAAKQASLWNDAKVGDPEFFEAALKPVVERETAFAKELGDPDAWDAATVKKGWSHLRDWMEFGYVVSDLRREHLLARRFREAGLPSN